MLSNKLPKISIITPSYNQARLIGKTIQSVLSQNYPNLEYILMDGGSTDGTLNILKRYKDRLIWFSQKDKGQSDAINKGIKKATGEIIGYLNSDDLLCENALFHIAEFYQNNPDYFWVTGRCQVIDERGDKIRSLVTLYKNFWLRFLRFPVSLFFINYISQPATFWRREVVNKIGYFDKSLYYVMDYDYWLRLSKIYKLGFIDKYLASFRIHKKSKSLKDPKAMLDEGYLVARRYGSSLFVFLHRLHDILTLLIYKLL